MATEKEVLDQAAAIREKRAAAEKAFRAKLKPLLLQQPFTSPEDIIVGAAEALLAPLADFVAGVVPPVESAAKP